MKPSNISKETELRIKKVLNIDDIYSLGNWRYVERDPYYCINSKGTHVVRIGAKDSFGRRLSDKCIVIFPSNKNQGKNSYLSWGHGAVHRTVAETFLENWDENLCVNHIDGDKWNNSVDNLEMCTVAENNQHFWFSEEFKFKRDQTKKLISEKNKGRKLSEETKSKMRGRIPWNLGLPCNEETKAKLSAINKGKPGPFKGKKHTLESKEKMSKAVKGKFIGTIWINNGSINKRIDPSEYSDSYPLWSLGRIKTDSR